MSVLMLNHASYCAAAAYWSGILIYTSLIETQHLYNDSENYLMNVSDLPFNSFTVIQQNNQVIKIHDVVIMFLCGFSTKLSIQ